MVQLVNSLQAWGSAGFREVLQAEMEALDAHQLPLQQALVQGSYATDNSFKVMFIGASEQPEGLCAKVGIFYTSIIGGCSCADDPTPVDELPEYCVLQVEISKGSANTRITLLSD